MSRSPLEAARLAATWPEAKAERRVAAAKARMGRPSGHVWAARTAGSRRRHSQSRVRRIRAPSHRVMEQHRPTTKATSRPRLSAITSVRVAVEEDADDRHADDLEIEPERPALDVLDVVLDARLQRGVAPEAVDLGPARHARLDLVAEHVAGHGLPEALDEHRPLRPRPPHRPLPA